MPHPDRQIEQAVDVRQAIARDIVHLHKEFYGKGPQRARTLYSGDVVVVVLRGGFTTVEQTLLDAGRGEDVIAQRLAFQEVMGERFKEVVEAHTGRRVTAFVSGSHQEPDLLVEVFVLEPVDQDDLLAGG